MVQFHACIGKLAPRHPVSARLCVTAAVYLISRKGIFLVLAHRTRLCVQTLAPRVILPQSVFLFCSD